MPSVISVHDTRLLKPIKNILDSNNVLDKSHKIARVDSVSLVYALAPPLHVSSLLEQYSSQVEIAPWELSAGPEDKTLVGTVQRYFDQITDSAKAQHVDFEELLSRVPKKWSVYHPMVLFGPGSFDLPEWERAFEKIDQLLFFSFIRLAFPATITHFAVNKPIVEEDEMRRPFNLLPLHGNFGPDPSTDLFTSPSADDLQDAFWCHVVQNGIYQTWAPRYTMFSRGNIKEKKRILDTFKNLRGQTVLDLYAGIGYFTLSYLANGATLFCWEINPWSIEGLVQGLSENGYKYKTFTASDDFDATHYRAHLADGVRAFIFHESNEEAVRRLSGLAPLEISHINLGLLPTLRPAWAIAQHVTNHLSSTSVTVHVHENVHVDEFDSLRKEIGTFYGGEVVHLEKVKTFAPDVWHVVVDVQAAP